MSHQSNNGTADLRNSAIDEDSSATDFQYGEGRPGGVSKNASVRLSALPPRLRPSATMYDRNGDGALSKSDIALAIQDLDNTNQKNRNLTKIISACFLLILVLIAAIFGASIAAARMSQEVSVNSANGFAYVKGSEETEVMKTEKAIVWEEGNVAELGNESLNRLTEVVLAGGDVRFQIKGSARVAANDNVVLLVEGGTLTWTLADGLVDASGYAKDMLEAAFGEDAFGNSDSDGRRRLLDSCGASWNGYGY